MLLSLYIENILLIKKLEVQFGPGMSVVTGETGSGKSVLVDCLSLALGGKVKGEILRSNQEKGLIVTEFAIQQNDEKLAQILLERDIPQEEGRLVIRRVITNSGSRSYISDIPVTGDFIQTIAPLLIDIRDQSQSPRGKGNAQWIDILDKYIGHQESMKAMLAQCSKTKEAQDKIAQVKAKIEANRKQREELKELVKDLEELNIQEEEEEQITEKKNQVKIMARLTEVMLSLQTSFKQANILDTLQKGYGQITRLSNSNESKEVESNLNLMSNACESGIAAVRELIELVEVTLGSASEGEGEFQKLEDRLHQIRSMARKYGTIPSALPDKLKDSKTFLQQGANLELELLQLEQELAETHQEYMKLGLEVSARRKEYARKLSQEVNVHARNLCLPNAHLEFRVETNEQAISEKGLDNVKCMVSLNQGFGIAPIESVSGGEMSRLSLALSLSVSVHNGIKSIIFDEIDSGVSGDAAIAMGKKMQELSRKVQVIAITHNHNIAACGEEHFLVSKSNIDGMATVSINKLTPKEKVNAMASMVYGKQFSGDEAQDFARKVISVINQNRDNANNPTQQES